MTEAIDRIDVEKIMDELREEIRKKGYKESDLSFSDIIINSTQDIQNDSFNEKLLIQNINEVNRTCRISWYQEIYGNRLSVFVKKVVRKFVKFLIIPIVEEQNVFNAVTTRSMNELLNYIRDNESLKERIAELEDLQANDSMQIKRLERELKQLKSK